MAYRLLPVNDAPTQPNLPALLRLELLEPRVDVMRQGDRLFGQADAATLAARPVAEIAGRSALAGAVRRFVGEAIDPPATSRPAAQPGRARSRERARGAVRGDARTA